MSPPGLGRSSRERAFRVVEVLGFSGLMSGACSVTRTFLARGGEAELEIDGLPLPEPAGTELFCCGAKRSASAFTEYMPGLSCGKLKRPESSVVHGSSEAVGLIDDGHVQRPAIAAPVGSVTDPTMALVVSPWAHAGTEEAGSRISGKRQPMQFRHA